MMNTEAKEEHGREKEPLVRLEEELIVQEKDLEKYKDSVSILQETYDKTKSDNVFRLMGKIQNILLDKEQIVVDIKHSIMKLKQAINHAKQVEQGVIEHYNKLQKIKDEKKLTKGIPDLPLEDCGTNQIIDIKRKKSTRFIYKKSAL